MSRSEYERSKPQHNLCGRCERYRTFCNGFEGVNRSKRTRCPEFKHSRKYTPNKVKEKKEVIYE